MQSAEPILSLRGIGKAFYGNRCDGVALDG